MNLCISWKWFQVCLTFCFGCPWVDNQTVPEWVQPNNCVQLFWAPMFTVITERLFLVVSSVVLFIKFLIALLFCFCHGADRASELLFTKTFIVFDIILNHGFLQSLVQIKSIFSGKGREMSHPYSLLFHCAESLHHWTRGEIRNLLYLEWHLCSMSGYWYLGSSKTWPLKFCLMGEQAEEGKYGVLVFSVCCAWSRISAL